MNRRGFFRGLLAAALAPAIKFFPAAKPPQVEFIDTEFGRVALCDQPQSTDTGFMLLRDCPTDFAELDAGVDQEHLRHLERLAECGITGPLTYWYVSQQANGGGATRKP